MKKILGLDLGTTSIGWAIVNQAENKEEQSSIIASGVRVNPLSTDEKDAFEKGKAITLNSDRRLKRSMRRNLQRYKHRRDNLIRTLRSAGILQDGGPLHECGSGSTLETYRLRSEAASQEISLAEFGRVLLMINKKRGYKSSRKTTGDEEGRPIDGMTVARKLAEEHITPGEYSFRLLHKDSRAKLPDFYRSDLMDEFERIWQRQQEFYPDILDDEFHAMASGKGKSTLSRMFYARHNVTTADNKGKEKKLTEYSWRADALYNELPIGQVAYALCAIAGDIDNASGYLGDISDRSKELTFQNLTIGQYLYRHLLQDKDFKVRGLVFYRQDYITEFDTIWECQSRFHPELTPRLRDEVKRQIIFYQRPLKSQKSLVSWCELESRPIKVTVDGKECVKMTGSKVAPWSSPLFQTFRTWQRLNDIRLKDKYDGSIRPLEADEKALLAQTLSHKKKLSATEILKLLSLKKDRAELNFKEIPGNETIAALYDKFEEIIAPAVNDLRSEFEMRGYNTAVLDYNPLLPKEEYERQPLFQLWHLIYSYEGDGSRTGDEGLRRKISELCGIPVEYVSPLASIAFKQDYASLSHKAISRILPHIMNGEDYSTACEHAGYNHSKRSLTKEQIAAKTLNDRLETLPKNSLRNPVVEKILNQMINVVNTLGGEYGRPDEIHIELARELKSSQADREKMTRQIAQGDADNARITEILQKDFGLAHVSKNDIVRYKLYDELKTRGYKTLYSDRTIRPEQLFSPDIDIEHIIPQALFFNDSLANKTLEFRDVNLEKGKRTAFDYIFDKYGDDGLQEYRARVKYLYDNGAISHSKMEFLLCPEDSIPEGFVNRDLKDSQYIARKAREILEEYVPVVMPTTGRITARLREDWGLIDVMKELNLPKYLSAGKVYDYTDHNGKTIHKIDDGWTKRNDHRHHAMDAITIAFTKASHIQYLNNLNAQSDKSSVIYQIREKETTISGKRRVFTAPIQPLGQMRAEVKRQLEGILVSIKAKNKVMTENINKIRTSSGVIRQKTLTPRGPLHKETIYGLRKKYAVREVPVGSKMTAEVIESVTSPSIKAALSRRLEECGRDPKKAFTGRNALAKNPIWIDEAHTKSVPDKVKCMTLETVYSIRKDIGPDIKIDKVMDAHSRRLLEARLEEFGGDIKNAFANLDENPIWYDKEHRIRLKKVTIEEHFNLDPIRQARDIDGNELCDRNGNVRQADYVNFRNNHHVAIFQDADGNLQEHIVSFYETVRRKSEGLPVVDRKYMQECGWEFLFTMKTNEMFVFPNPESGFDPNAIDLTDRSNYPLISPNLFRVQMLSSKDYCFRHHLETESSNSDKVLKGITWKRIKSISYLKGAVKVRINHIGQIVSVGEYD